MFDNKPNLPRPLLLRGIKYQNVHRRRVGNTVGQVADFQNAVNFAPLIIALHHQQVQIGVLRGRAVSVGTEQNNPVRRIASHDARHNGLNLGFGYHFFALLAIGC